MKHIYLEVDEKTFMAKKLLTLIKACVGETINTSIIYKTKDCLLDSLKESVGVETMSVCAEDVSDQDLVLGDDDDIFWRAYSFSEKKHECQLDDCGKDYFIEHVLKVGLLICKLTIDPDVRAAALLHDTIEDTDTTYEELLETFNKRVADLVMEVTHEGCKDHYGYYFPRLKTKEAILIKLVDRASNVSRMGSWSNQRQQNYLDKTKFWKDGKDKED